MHIWVESFNKFKEYINLPQSKKVNSSLPAADFVEGLTGWLHTEITEYTEGSSEGVSRRAVWVFDDRWILTLGTDINLTIAGLHDKVDDSLISGLFDSLDDSEWVYNYNVNGWGYTEPLEYENLIWLIEEMSKILGTPKLFLPWEYRIDNAVDEGEDFYSYWDEDDEKHELYKSFYELMVLLSEGKIDKVSPWNIVLVGEDDCMSDYCVYSRFFEVVDELQKSGEWLVIIDEHCAACSRGSRESEIANNPNLKDAPEFMTWGQNSQHSYLPDGQMWAEVMLDDYVWGLKLIRIANKHGFNMDVPQNEDDYAGAVTFE